MRQHIRGSTYTCPQKRHQQHLEANLLQTVRSQQTSSKIGVDPSQHRPEPPTESKWNSLERDCTNSTQNTLEIDVISFRPFRGRFGTVASFAGQPTGMSKNTFSESGRPSNFRIFASAPIGVEVRVAKFALCKAARNLEPAMPSSTYHPGRTSYRLPNTGGA